MAFVDRDRTIAKTFKVDEGGMARILGHLEKEVMDALWKTGGACGKTILAELSRKRPVAHTTVLTVLKRLAEKGLVKRKKEGELYIYGAAYAEEELSRMVSKEVLKGVLELARNSAVAQFVDVLAKEDPRQLERLSALVEEKKRELLKEK
jgi:predicted transcriptional regulator